MTSKYYKEFRWREILIRRCAAGGKNIATFWNLKRQSPKPRAIAKTRKTRTPDLTVVENPSQHPRREAAATEFRASEILERVKGIEPS